MGIVGHHPESGVRIEVERSRESGPPWRYEGEAVTPGMRFPVAATVADDGVVNVELEAAAPPGLAEKVRLLLKTAWRHADQDDAAPPKRIVRWRPDSRF
jgi:hypothetical protein